MRFGLDGRAAVVTGALGRLGPIWSRALLEAGASVAALDLPGADPTSVAALQEEFPGRLVVLSGDVLDRPSLERARAACVDAIGEPTILVNNAGIDQPPSAIATTLLQDVPVDAVRSVLDVNTMGVFLAMQVFGGGMLSTGGSIVNVGSLYLSVSPDARMYEHLGLDPPFLKPPGYGASKAALHNLTRYFATHWAAEGVRVNTLSPGGVSGGQDETFTRLFSSRVPLGRLAEHHDLGGPLVFLASDASSYVTGIELRVDGGFTAW